MATTLADIAKQAGVSQATVSRVINDKPGVSDEKRAAILQLMNSLGVPKPTALPNETQLVALISPDLSNPIFPSLINTLTPLLLQQQLMPILATYALSGTEEASIIAMLHNQPIVGAIFLGGIYDNAEADHSVYQPLIDRGVPTVFLNGPSRDIDGLYIQTDDANAMILAVRHLVNLGHRDIGLLLGDRYHIPTVAMHDAAVRFLNEQGLPHDPELTAWTTYGIDSGTGEAAKLFAKGATAIACANDQLAIGAIKAAHTAGLNVPGDVSITGFDDSSLAAHISPTLTTLRQPVDAMCRSIVRGLAAMMADRTLPAKREAMTFQPELIVRDSTAMHRQR